ASRRNGRGRDGGAATPDAGELPDTGDGGGPDAGPTDGGSTQPTPLPTPTPTPTPAGNRPPALEPLGSRRANAGEVLAFRVRARDPDLDLLEVAAERLPDGA